MPIFKAIKIVVMKVASTHNKVALIGHSSTILAETVTGIKSHKVENSITLKSGTLRRKN